MIDTVWIGVNQKTDKCRKTEHFRQAPEAQGYGFNITESLSSNIDDKTMHELYMWPFQDAVRVGVGAIMCSYQQLNNSYACQNSKTLNGLLKSELGFQGFVMSDWQAQHAGVASAVAGLDMSMPGDTVFNSGVSYWGANLTLAVINGTVPEWRIDDMAMRIMASFFKTGQKLDQPDINFSSWTDDTVAPIHIAAQERIEQVNFHVDVRDEYAYLIREIASRGTVLLKNTGILPLDKPKFLAVVGKDASANPKGPNGCSDGSCNDGTLAVGWGSARANFPYLVTPDAALQRRVLEYGGRYETIIDNYATDKINALVSQENATAIVFVNANSGEGYISVDNNMGDRKNLTLWENGDALIRNVSSLCPNTIVVIHSVGPVLIEDYKYHENITAILWAGLPGQESGNSIAEVLFGDVNPGGKTPFTWGKAREDWGAHILDEPNNGADAPQDSFPDGIFIDYRHFDKEGIEPTYEFGYGLSYTTFEYSNLVVQKVHFGDYMPADGMTEPAPIFGGSSNNTSRDFADYVFPDDLDPVEQYIYPWLDGSTPEEASGDAHYGMEASEFLPDGATDGSAQPVHPAGGGQPGGNPMIWDVMYVVTATVKNTGNTVGDEVAQLYVSLGGPEDPPVVLRGFDRIRLDPGMESTFRVDILRRDLSNWDPVIQNWIISEYPKKIYVGSSSRKLHLEATLEWW